MTDFTTIVSNTLPDVHMIAGDQQTFEYEVNNTDGTPIDLQYATCKVIIFRYGDPNYVFANLTGTVVLNGSYYNKFYVNFSGEGWSGVYQHQVRITDAHSIDHIPAQGKLIVFPSPQNSQIQAQTA
jgi:hypothetical protein